jgi:hypothetical protein
MTPTKKYFSKSGIVISAVVCAKQTLFRCLLRPFHHNFSPHTIAAIMEIMAYVNLGAAMYAGWAYDDRY